MRGGTGIGTLTLPRLGRAGLIFLDLVVAAAIVAVALPPRQSAAQSYNEPPQSEEELYNRYAVSWAKHEAAEPREQEFPWHPLGSFTHRPPGYVLFLGAIYQIAGIENFAAVRQTQALLDVGTILLLYVLGTLIFGGLTGRAVGATAAIGVATYDFQTLLVARILSETLFTFLLVFGLVLALLGLLKKWPIVTGVAAFVLTWANLTRPFITFLLPGLLLWIALAPQYPHPTWLEKKKPHLLAALVGILLAMIPIWVRNYQFHDRFILISTNTGFTLYQSLAETEGLTAPERLGTKEEVKALELGELGESAEFQKRAIDYMIEYPGDVKKVLARKVQILLAAKDGHKISHVLMATPDDSWFYPLVLILGAIGVLIRPFWMWHPRLLIYGAIVSQVLVCLIANAEVRYRVPIIPLLAILAAWAVWGIVDAVIGRFRTPI